MRVLLLALAVLAAAGCDSTTTGETPPEPEFVGVLVTYRVSVVGNAFDSAVTYTDADGETQSEPADFSRTSTFIREVTLDPGVTGTFTVSASALVDTGRLSARITATRLDTGDEVATASEFVTTTSASEEASVTASVEIQAVEVPAVEARQP